MQGRNELCAVLIYSEKVNATIKKIDFAEAMNVKGVVGHISAQDLKETQNSWGAMIDDEPVFAFENVSHHGQVIAALLCSSNEVGKKARKLVNITYEQNKEAQLPPVYGLGDVMEKSGISALEKLPNFGGAQRLRRYLDDDYTSSTDQVIEGTVKIGGQQHFYLEPHNVLIVPIGEKSEYTVYVGTQSATLGVQKELARVLNVPKHKITVITKRTGGAFGGKER